MRLVTGRKTQEQRLELLANYDDLTGHFNKKRLREVLDHQLAASLRAGNSGAYLAVGIDKLATINDAFGYDAADQVLIEKNSEMPEEVPPVCGMRVYFTLRRARSRTGA